jgi:hypothetical protein
VQPGNTYVDNDTGGYGMVLLTGTAKNNRGYNPLQSLAVPVAPVPSTAATGGTVLAGTYGVEVTYVNVQGESLPSANGPITTTGTTSTIKIPSPPGAGNAWGWYAYVTQVNGVTFTRQQTAGSPTPLGTNLTLTAPPTNTGANPPGANTTGGVTTPAVPATGVALQNTTGVDCTVVIATVGGLTAVTIGGLVLTAAPVAGSSYRVPSRQTITLTWATTAPTWQWIGD